MKSPMISSRTHQPATGWWLLPALCVSCTLLLCLAPEASEARPAYESWSVYRAALTGANSRRTNECELSGEVKTLCQQCAKVTRSNLVYPMCCTDREEARPWCSSYVNFGI